MTPAFVLQSFGLRETSISSSSLLSLLDFTRKTESTDVRDKDYASQSLAKDVPPASILPD